MKTLGKACIVGLVIGAAELGAAGLMAGVAKWALFEDLAFGMGIATLLFGLLVLFGGGKRVWSGAGSVNSSNPTPSTAFAAQVAFEEARMARKMPSFSGSLGRVVAIFVAALVTLAGFGISLAF